ncbi:hypothetical protein CXY01_04080 [Cellulomonas xylanilytica]|uniref:Uncharacterized protein n=1 Tax=Cellulomonas xylanilytica TaxID=233583 RepID=A0A510UZ15_9CELL|nr:hypothetical protein CXY01_04080 [Cellulomonas xylanilytica]
MRAASECIAFGGHDAPTALARRADPPLDVYFRRPHGNAAILRASGERGLVVMGSLVEVTAVWEASRLDLG